MYFLLVLLYGGPDTVMPIASALAAVIGVLLMLWKRAAIIFRKFIQSFRPPTPKLRTTHPPGKDQSVRKTSLNNPE